MKVIFGLGNPGIKYENTRHNIGFKVIDKIASFYNIKLKLQKNWICGNGENFILIKPLSYVNESGVVAKKVISTYNVAPQIKSKNDEFVKQVYPNFLVVFDDFTLQLGTTRMRLQGSSGGHNGVESIIYHLETEKFPRIRIGIGKPIEESAVKFVLSKFKRSELKILNSAIEKTILTINSFIQKDDTIAMEICNLPTLSE